MFAYNTGKKARIKRRTVRAAALILSALFALSLLLPFGASAKDTKKIVRVGWYESPFNKIDEFGRRSGYAYDYQQKIAAFTGWDYEYVEASWPDLLQMLIDGRIDLLSDVSYTEERAEKMLFSSLPMGSEEYCLYIDPGNKEISVENLATLNGKKIGVDKSSVQADFLREWIAANDVDAEIVEMSDTVAQSLEKLYRGAIDVYVALDGYFNTENAIPVCRIGSSDFYFAVSKSRPELIEALNSAMTRIRSENPNYNQQLDQKYLNIIGINYYLSAEEQSWIASHGAIRVGYQDNYLAFCATDPATGELTGALKDYLAIASGCLANADLSFEAIGYPTASEAMEALKKGEVDCMFPANLTDYDGEVQGYFMTAPIMRTDISAIVLESEQKAFSSKERVVVAVNKGNPNYQMFLLDNFPEWRSIIFEDTPACLKAIAEGKADCLLMSNYRFNNISLLCEKYGLIALSTGVEMDYSFAVRRSDTLLYSILNKVAGVVPDATVNAALSYYYTEDAKLTLGDLLLQNFGIVAAIFTVVLVVILVLLIHSIRAKKKGSANQQLIHATETDPLTGLYIKTFFHEYTARYYRENPEKPMDMVVLNIEQFHSVNAIHGWAFGDKVLRTLAGEISDFAGEQNAIAGRVGVDRFAIYCPHLADPYALFTRLQKSLDALSQNAWIRLCMGVKPWEKNVAPRLLAEQALVACSMARGRYKEHMVVFDESIRKHEDYEQRLKNSLNRAIVNKEFKVYFQPKYDIRSDKPTLKSAEALVRWLHPELGMIPPGDFIPLFERSGQVSIVDRYVWEQTAAQIARWREKYGVTVPVSVNLSRVDIFDPTLESTLDRILRDHDLDYSALKLEVTESAYTENPDQIISVIERLRTKGYEIEMDDFGTGYSSLIMLSSIPFSVLKMDRGFIKNINHSQRDNQLVAVMIDIAKKLNVEVIAEGVETEEQLRLLKELGCQQVQGFYFSRPLPASEFEAAHLKKEA